MPIMPALGCLSKVWVDRELNNYQVEIFINTGSSNSYISKEIINKLNLNVKSGIGKVTFAQTTLSSQCNESCIVNIKLNGNEYKNVQLTILPSLCAEILLCQDISGFYSNVDIKFVCKLHSKYVV